MHTKMWIHIIHSKILINKDSTTFFTLTYSFSLTLFLHGYTSLHTITLRAYNWQQASPKASTYEFSCLMRIDKWTKAFPLSLHPQGLFHVCFV